MTKVQIATKSILTGLIVYAAVLLLRHLEELPYYGGAAGAPRMLFLAALCVGLTIGAGWYIAAVSDRLAAGAVERDTLSPERSQRLLAQALTLTMVALGLVLLPGTVATLVGFLKVPFVLRGWIQRAIVGHGLPPGLRLSMVEWFGRVADLAEMLLVFYLLCGAPGLVRWQVARAVGPIPLKPREDERLGNG